jgi:hypothetical protein
LCGGLKRKPSEMEAERIFSFFKLADFFPSLWLCIRRERVGANDHSYVAIYITGDFFFLLNCMLKKLCNHRYMYLLFWDGDKNCGSYEAVMRSCIMLMWLRVKIFMWAPAPAHWSTGVIRLGMNNNQPKMTYQK